MEQELRTKGGGTLNPELSPAKGSEDGNLVRLLLEAIDQHAARHTRDSIIEHACSAARLTRLPQSSSGLLLFVHSYLMCELRLVLGGDIADAILDEVELVLERASQAAPSQAPDSDDDGRPSNRKSGEQLRVGAVLVAMAARQRRDRVVKMVQLAGWRAVEAADGVTALAMCSRHHPAVVICDVALPGVDGPALAQLLALAFGDQAPRTVLLASDRRVPKGGPFVDAVLSRPLQPDELVTQLMLSDQADAARAAG